MATKKTVEQDVLQDAAAPVEEVVNEDPKRLVPVYVFKGEGKYKDDITIGVNGKIWRIKRGRTVMVPDYVKAVLDNSLEQDRRALEMQDRMVQESAEEYGRIGL